MSYFLFEVHDEGGNDDLCVRVIWFNNFFNPLFFLINGSKRNFVFYLIVARPSVKDRAFYVLTSHQERVILSSFCFHMTIQD